uniref:Uncharacterized protein n=1 Tax=Arundo donax TaxID=35708 RepID=A0A0A9FJ87_ARUDO
MTELNSIDRSRLIELQDTNAGVC